MAVSVVLFGLAEFGNPVDDLFQVLRNKFTEHAASDKIVVVGIDSEAQNTIGAWPWSTDDNAAMVNRLIDAGAKRVFFDNPVQPSRADGSSSAFIAALKRGNGRVFLPANFAMDASTGQHSDSLPPLAYRQYAGLANSNLWVDGFNAVKRAPFALEVGGQPVRSIASIISDVRDAPDTTFPVDYSIDIESIPYVSAAKMFDPDADLSAIAGRDVIIGPNAQRLGESYTIVGRGPVSSTFINAIAAETLVAGRPSEIGWQLLWAVALLLVLALRRAKTPLGRLTVIVAALALFTAGSLGLEAEGLVFQLMPAIVLFAGVAGYDAVRRYRAEIDRRGRVNAVSGLPNLNALREDGQDKTDGLVVARVGNYAEVATALPASMEKNLVDQIAMRLTLGNGGRSLYQGDEGIFMWLIPADAIGTVGDQLAALHAIFRSAANVAGRHIDLAVNFGVDADPGRSIQSRMSSALLASQEAAGAGETWRVYDPTKLEATEWKVSMLGELDAAIDNDDVWVAFQPQLDLNNHHISGAEALIRWNHPEKGPINPEEFITVAERHDRIEKLTEHVLNRAIAIAAQINASGTPFDIAVNLSSRLIGHPNLRPMVSQALRRHGLPPQRLILEITETAAMSSAKDAVDELKALRAIGLQLSIDDYGTGFSTLDYLKRCPVGELKIDRSFVRMLTSSRSDRIMVNSTIELAHSLGDLVVAEGVEDSETLQLLQQMGCDKAQGFLIARPMDAEALFGFLSRHQASRAA